jgi:hypothetical protein
MKVTAGKNAILFNVDFDGVDTPITLDNESQFGCGKVNLRMRFALWVFNFILTGRLKRAPHVMNCTVTATQESQERASENLETFLNSCNGTPLHNALRR